MSAFALAEQLPGNIIAVMFKLGDDHIIAGVLASPKL